MNKNDYIKLNNKSYILIICQYIIQIRDFLYINQIITT